VNNAYENTTSRLKSIPTRLGRSDVDVRQGRHHHWHCYSHAVNPTPNVSFAYDPYFRRITSVTDGNAHATTLSAARFGRRASAFERIRALPNDSITYQYDALSRLIERTVDSSTETFAYDKLSRLTTHGTALGTFNSQLSRPNRPDHQPADKHWHGRHCLAI